MSAFSNFALDDNLQKPTQGRRQDLVAGGANTRRRGQKTEGGSHFWNTVLDICSNQGAKRETGGHRLQMGGPGTTGSPAGDGLEPTSAACFQKDRETAHWSISGLHGSGSNAVERKCGFFLLARLLL